MPLYVFFDENGQMDKRDFLQLWKEIPEQNEIQFSLTNNNNLLAGNNNFFYIYINKFFISFY